MEKVYVKVCKYEDLKEDQTVIEVEGKNVLLIKLDGNVYALENKCTHERLPLNGGDIHDGQIQCPHHGARYEIKSGRATQFPAVMDMKTYDVKIENDDVLVAL